MNKNAPQKLRVLIIVNRLYEWSQNFITRELVELNRQGVEVYIGAREMVKRDDLTGRDQLARQFHSSSGESLLSLLSLETLQIQN